MSIDTLAPAIRQDGFFSESLASADPEMRGLEGLLAWRETLDSERYPRRFSLVV